MLNSKIVKITISIILVFCIAFFYNMFWCNIVYAESSLGDLNSYNGRRWRKFAKTGNNG